jgi:acetyl/propionyl-CoA carboxylase alpha subunit
MRTAALHPQPDASLLWREDGVTRRGRVAVVEGAAAIGRAGDVDRAGAVGTDRAGDMVPTGNDVGTAAEVDIDDAGRFTVVRAGDMRHVFGPHVRVTLRRVDALAHAAEDAPHGGHLTAPMSGTIVAVLAEPGASVAQGAPLVVLEAMKMEHTIVAPANGVVRAVNCAVGDRVAEGADVVDLDDGST